MMRRTLQRWTWWLVAAVLVAGIGYTAGYILSPPEPTTVSRTLPDTPPDSRPMTPRIEPIDEA
ncbi:MAG: hypothetical protein AB7N70_21490 [Dehalococcoidia bacterium]